MLDLGCGRNKRSGAVGVDRVPSPGVDVVHDLDRFPYPFADGSFDRVYASHLLEHLGDVVGAMGEIHRIAKPGGYVYIEVPHFSCVGGFTDPTHRRHFGLGSMDYFSVESPHDAEFSYTDRRFRMLSKRITFNKAVVNLIPKFLYFLSPEKYEKYFSFIFPARFLEFELEVVK
jgi:SAM-dependent methyltransferase